MESSMKVPLHGEFMLAVQVIVTPEHQYLRVQEFILEEMNFVPTPRSYYGGGYGWLEDACDMPAFLWAYGKGIELRPIFQDHDIPKRSLQSYPIPMEQT